MTAPPEPDAIFADPRLASIYDAFEGERHDLVHYLAMVDEFGARSVLDVGCGTGELACRLAQHGCEVVAVDPAGASLEVARAKPGAERVRWVLGDVSLVSSSSFDLVVMTGNVAQVFVEDETWDTTLRTIGSLLGSRGRLVFEVRDPSMRAWEGWSAAATRQTREIDGCGTVEAWTELVDVSLPLVSFRHTYRFHEDGAVVTSDSTLRFRERSEIESGLAEVGFAVVDVRDAPDRPGKEFVFVAVPSDEGQRGGTHE